MVIGPPAASIFVSSARVRSGLISSQLVPSSSDRSTTLAATYRTPGSWREATMGYVHWNRYLWCFTP